MVSFSDLANGPKLFAENWGPKWGPWGWRIIFTLAVLAIAVGCVAEIGGAGKVVVTDLVALFSTSKPSTAPPLRPPSDPQSCIISGGTNNGVQMQNCPTYH
jgi:hypothetical protein